MSREIVTFKDIQSLNQSSGTSKTSSGTTYPAGIDKYVDRLFKYIPSELVAGYLLIAGVMKQLTKTEEILIFQWVVFILFCILTPFYLWRIQKVIKIQQHIISLFSFIVWIFTLGGPFMLYDWYNPVYGEILLPVFTFAVAIWEAEW